MIGESDLSHFATEGINNGLNRVLYPDGSLVPPGVQASVGSCGHVSYCYGDKVSKRMFHICARDNYTCQVWGCKKLCHLCGGIPRYDDVEKYPNGTPTPKYIFANSKAELSCGHGNICFVHSVTNRVFHFCKDNPRSDNIWGCKNLCHLCVTRERMAIEDLIVDLCLHNKY